MWDANEMDKNTIRIINNILRDQNHGLLVHLQQEFGFTENELVDKYHRPEYYTILPKSAIRNASRNAKAKAKTKNAKTS